MKTIVIILISLSVSFGVAAQRKGGYYHVYAPRVYVAPYSYGFGFGYPYFGSPYGYPYGYGYGARRVPYKLSLQIQDIKSDYKAKIKEERHNKSVSGSERRKEIRELKAERDQDIMDAERNFRTRRMNNQNNGSNNNQNQENSNSSPGDNSNQQNNPS